MKNRTIVSKIPPRFAKKQSSMSIEQPEETLSTSSLGTEIWETNSTGESGVLVVCQVCHLQYLDFKQSVVFVFEALTVKSSGGDSWTKQVSYTGSEPNSEVMMIQHSITNRTFYIKKENGLDRMQTSEVYVVL